MELSFAEKNFRDLCYNETLAKQVYGSTVAGKLKRILADLGAVTVAADLFALPGNARALSGDLQGRMVINVVDEHQLVFQVGHINPPLLQSGEVDWSRVRRIKILGLEKNHE